MRLREEDKVALVEMQWRIKEGIEGSLNSPAISNLCSSRTSLPAKAALPSLIRVQAVEVSSIDIAPQGMGQDPPAANSRMLVEVCETEVSHVAVLGVSICGGNLGVPLSDP
jgi:hypothetical protein